MTTNPESLLAVTQCDHGVRHPHPCDDCLDADIPSGKRLADHPCYGLAFVAPTEFSHRAYLSKEGPIYCERCGTELDRNKNQKAGVRLSWQPRPAPPTQPGREEVVGKDYKSFTDGMEAAAQICGTLAEHPYDDTDAFEAATGCEAAIMRVVKQQRAEQAALAAEPLLARQDGRAEAEELLHELNNLPMVHKGVQFDGWLLSEPTLKAILAALSTIPTEPASVREERLREALEHTRDELVRLAWDENHPLIVRIEAALSTEEPTNG